MPSFRVETPQRCYSAIVERGVIGHLAPYIPSKAGKLFVISTEDVWRHQGGPLDRGLAAERGVDLRQQRGGNLDDRNAAHENGGEKTGHVADNAAAEGHTRLERSPPRSTISSASCSTGASRFRSSPPGRWSTS